MDTLGLFGIISPTKIPKVYTFGGLMTQQLSQRVLESAIFERLQGYSTFSR